MVMPGWTWIGNNNTSGGDYVGGYPASILLHMTVSMGLSMSYAKSHAYPPHCWYNVYTGDKWQALELNRSGKALYQPSYTNSYTNRKWHCIQTELVGVPEVSVATYSKAQCDAIAANVVVPQVQWLRQHGMDVNLNNVRYHPNTSGSASEYWHGRMGDAEWAAFDGLCAHIDAVGNDHWDCSAERMDWIASESIRILGGGSPTAPGKPVTGKLLELGMFLLQNDRRGIWLMGPGYAKGLNEEEYSQAKAIPGIQHFYCGNNERAFDLVYGVCMNGATAVET
jgi:hypothetical protein